MWKTEDYENESIIVRALKGKEKVMKGFGGEEENFKINTIYDGEPAKLLKRGNDMYELYLSYMICEFYMN